MKTTVHPETDVPVRARLVARSLSHIAYVSIPSFSPRGLRSPTSCGPTESSSDRSAAWQATV